jgi:hypothetical protein
MAWSRTVDTSAADTLGEYRCLMCGLFITANFVREMAPDCCVLRRFLNVELVTGIEPAL